MFRFPDYFIDISKKIFYALRIRYVIKNIKFTSPIAICVQYRKLLRN